MHFLSCLCRPHKMFLIGFPIGQPIGFISLVVDENCPRSGTIILQAQAVSCYGGLKAMGAGVNKLIIFSLSLWEVHQDISFLAGSRSRLMRLGEGWHRDPNTVLEEAVSLVQPVQPGSSAAQTALAT